MCPGWLEHLGYVDLQVLIINKQTNRENISLRSRPDYMYFCRLVIIPFHSLPAPFYAQTMKIGFQLELAAPFSYIYISGIKVCLCVCAL